ncbi:MAG TPA: aminodeoxychorismate lyase [Verrucomicrobiae bacterium]|nr:aminodeoxychorismate lyase [Verrucomicrobiae bacterium]
MRVFLNGRVIPEEQALVPLTDRGLLYGDGLFETLRVRRGRPAWWERHLARFTKGAAYLRIQLPYSAQELWAAAHELIRINEMPEAVLRITLTRGVGVRGYSPKNTPQPTLAMMLHPVTPAPTAVRLVTSSHRVAVNDALASHKTSNKLLAVLARAEADDAGADEALILNTDGDVAESAAGNVFWLEPSVVCTPDLSCGVLAGVMRGVVLETCRERGWPVAEKRSKPEALHQAEGVFLTNSVAGIMPVSSLDGRAVRSSQRIATLQEALTTKELSELAHGRR